MRILFIGDVVGEPGRKAVKKLVPALREEHGIDCVVINGENSAGGSGITRETASELFAGGADIITSGDHLWDQRDVMELLVSEPRFVRPLNYPAGTPGQGSTVHRISDTLAVGVINLQGRTFMRDVDNPFQRVRSEVESLRSRTPIILVDMHAETTAEKIAMGRMLDGSVSAVIGTHTHVQTADEQIFPGGTAYLTDAGFTGPHESVIGREIEPVLKKFLTYQPQRFPVARDRVLLQGAIVDVDPATGKAIAIIRVSEPLRS